MRTPDLVRSIEVHALRGSGSSSSRVALFSDWDLCDWDFCQYTSFSVLNVLLCASCVHAWRMGAIGRAMSGSPAGAAKLRHSTSTPSVGIVREVHYGQLHTDARAAPHACPPINQCSSCTGVYWRGSVVCAFDSVHACMRACGACATCCACRSTANGNVARP